MVKKDSERRKQGEWKKKQRKGWRVVQFVYGNIPCNSKQETHETQEAKVPS